MSSLILTSLIALRSSSKGGVSSPWEHELGFFCQRLSGAVRRYPEVTRRGVQMAWLAWALLFAIALSPIDPMATRWDEVVLGALALGVAWRRLGGARQVGH